MFWINNITILGWVSLLLMALWVLGIFLKKKWAFALFAIAHSLLYIDCFLLKNHFHFELAFIMLGISALVGIIQWIRLKKFTFSKQLAIYLLISAVPALLFILVLLSF